MTSSKTRLTGRMILTGALTLAVGLTAPGTVQAAGAATGADSEASAAKTVQINVDHYEKTVATRASTVGDVLAESGVEIRSADQVSPQMSARVSGDSEITVLRSKTVRIKAGRAAAVSRSVPARTVQGALNEAGVKLRSRDIVSPGRWSSVHQGSTIVVKRVTLRSGTRDTAIKPRTVKRKTNTLYKGESRTQRAGRNGVLRSTYRHTFVNDRHTSSAKVGSRVLRQPTARVVLVGAKDKPSLSGVWRSLAKCESGLNPRAVSPNGLYHGLFQFSVATWRTVGGSGLPSQASSDEQLKRAKILQSRSGWGQWPACSSKLGLR